MFFRYLQYDKGLKHCDLEKRYINSKTGFGIIIWDRPDALYKRFSIGFEFTKREIYISMDLFNITVFIGKMASDVVID